MHNAADLAPNVSAILGIPMKTRMGVRYEIPCKGKRWQHWQEKNIKGETVASYVLLQYPTLKLVYSSSLRTTCGKAHQRSLKDREIQISKIK